MFEFDVNAVFKEACAIIAAGGRVLKNHGITPEGYCTCGATGHHINGKGQKQCGKHPAGGDGWQHRAARTEEELEQWLEQYEQDKTPFNLGLLLGPTTGIIDIEWDDPLAERFAEQMGLKLIETPTYCSGRSEHRLFLWNDAFSVVEKAVVRPGGLEVRLGAGKMAAQSVVPCSWHWKGIQYRWKPTLGISEVEFAEVPKDLAKAIVTGQAGGRGHYRPKSSRHVIHGDVGEGYRHPTLLALCTKLVMINPLYQNDDEQEDILGLLWNTNLQNCKPPKSREEVASILHSCVAYRREMEMSGERTPATRDDMEAAAAKIAAKMENGDVREATGGYALQGLVWRPVDGSPEGEWLPGSWRIRMIHSDPPEIELIVEQWSDTPCGGRITFAFDEFRSATKVANKVFSATRRVILDGDRAEWERVWRGQEGNSKRPKIRGLIEKLVEQKDRSADVHVGSASLRFATLAAFLLEQFARATRPRNEAAPEPNLSGKACWVNDGELWFKWGKTWEEIGRSHDVQAGERIRMRHLLCQAMGVEDLPEGRHSFSGARHSYVVFTPEWVDAVQELADGGRTAGSQIAQVAQIEDEIELPPNTGFRNGVRGAFSAQDFRFSRQGT